MLSTTLENICTRILSQQIDNSLDAKGSVHESGYNGKSNSEARGTHNGSRKGRKPLAWEVHRTRLRYRQTRCSRNGIRPLERSGRMTSYLRSKMCKSTDLRVYLLQSWTSFETGEKNTTKPAAYKRAQTKPLPKKKKKVKTKIKHLKKKNLKKNLKQSTN